MYVTVCDCPFLSASPLLPHVCYTPIHLDFSIPLVWSLSPKHPIISCIQYSLSHPQILFSLHPTTSPIPYYAITPYLPGIPGRESFSLIHLTTFLWCTRSRWLALFLLIRLLHFASLLLFVWFLQSLCFSQSYSITLNSFHINNLWVRTLYAVLDSYSVLA